MSWTKCLILVACLLAMVAAPGTRSAQAQAPAIPEQLTAIREQLAAIQASLTGLPGQETSLTAIQSTLASLTASVTALQQSLANVDPTVSRPVMLATTHAFVPEGKWVSCSAHNVGTTTFNVTFKILNLQGVLVQEVNFDLAPGSGNGVSILGHGGTGPTAFRWCKFEYTGAPNALRAAMEVDDTDSGAAHAIYEAR